GELPGGFGPAIEPMSEDNVWSRIQRLNDDLVRGPQRLPLFGDALGRLQARIDQETEEFINENSPLKQTGDLAELKRRLNHFMQHHVETFLTVIDSLLAQERPAAVLSQT